MPAMRRKRSGLPGLLPVTCPYCKKRSPKPTPFEENADALGGRCECGAFYVADDNGRLSGQALVDGLTMLAGGDIDKGMTLTKDVDYELEERLYDAKRFMLEPRAYRRGAYGIPKLWFFRKPPQT